MAEETAQTGYYIFKPSNLSNVNTPGYQNLFLDGTEFVGASEGRASDIEKLQKIELEIIEGFGFAGNSSGGAVGGLLTVDPPPVAAPVTPTAPPPSSGGPTYRSARNYGTPVAGTTTTGPGPSPSFLSNLLGGN